jgi:hypothetical protein
MSYFGRLIARKPMMIVSGIILALIILGLFLSMLSSSPRISE